MFTVSLNCFDSNFEDMKSENGGGSGCLYHFVFILRNKRRSFEKHLYQCKTRKMR